LLGEGAADIELCVVGAERFGADDADRGRQVEDRAANARAGHDDFAALRGIVASGGVLGHLLRESWAGKSGHQRYREKRTRNPELFV
jgi:hypothetical protein